ncbi:F-Box/Wd Repeat-Containing Protein 5 [Manis pentadactyla]|nr:F-Box/Wd Repeat-Containing Protein 5 [Manis pentadactyla]
MERSRRQRKVLLAPVRAAKIQPSARFSSLLSRPPPPSLLAAPDPLQHPARVFALQRMNQHLTNF